MDRITLKQAKEALSRSGYLLESHIETLLLANGFYVESNTAYLDPLTGKSRELDLYAIQGWKLSRNYDFIFPVLLIECVNNPQPIAFITKESIVDFINIDALQMAGLPVKVFSFDKEKGWTPIRDYLKMQDYHHYCRGRIATQFCSFSKKRATEEWMALHEDSQFDSLRKLCDVVEYTVDKQFTSWSFSEAPEPINIELYHPVLVLQGKLVEVRTSRRGTRLMDANHIQFRRTAIVKNEPRDYQIDVVTSEYFQKYLDMLHAEWKQTERRIKRRRNILEKSIEKIIREARRFRAPEKIRDAMDL